MNRQQVFKPINAPRREIEEFAESIGEISGYYQDFDIKRAVKALRGEIVPVEDWDSHSGDGLLVEAADSFAIFLPLSSSVPRNKALIAHEIGHLMLHYFYNDLDRDGRSVLFPRLGQGPAEDEADWFAIGFLAPRKRVREEFEKSRSVEDIAQSFGVSPAIIRARLPEFTGAS